MGEEENKKKIIYYSSEDIQSELKVSPLVEKVDECKNRWREYVHRMEKDPINKGCVFLFSIG